MADEERITSSINPDLVAVDEIKAQSGTRGGVYKVIFMETLELAQPWPKEGDT